MRVLKGLWKVIFVVILITNVTFTAFAYSPPGSKKILTPSEKELLKFHSFCEDKIVRWPDDTIIYVYDETNFSDLDIVLDAWNDFFARKTYSNIILKTTRDPKEAQIIITWDDGTVPKDLWALTVSYFYTSTGYIYSAKIWIKDSIESYLNSSEMRYTVEKAVKDEIVSKNPEILYYIIFVDPNFTDRLVNTILKFLDRARMVLIYIHELGHALGCKGHFKRGIMESSFEFEEFDFISENVYVRPRSFNSKEIDVVIEIEGVDFDEDTIEFSQLLYSLPVGFTFSE